MKRVIALIVVAIVLAAGTGVASYYYLQQAEDRALAQFDRVTVVETSGSITAGTKFADAQAAGLFRTIEIPRKYLSASMVQSEAAVDPALVANRDLPANQLLMSGDFQNSTAAPKILPVPDGYVALGVPMDIPSRMAPFVSPGDVVALYGNKPASNGGVEPALLYPEIRILAIGNTSVLGTSASAEIATGMVTFAVPQDKAAEFLAHVRAGGLTMAVLPNSNVAVTQ